MKKRVAFLLAVFLLSLSLSVSALADISVVIDGNKLSFDVPPTMIDGRTMVPLRAIFEAMGAKIQWEEEIKKITATKGSTVIVLHVDDTSAIVNGKKVPLDVPASAIEGRTMVPTRFIAESLGAKVIWDGTTSTVVITSTNPPVEEASLEGIIYLDGNASNYKNFGEDGIGNIIINVKNINTGELISVSTNKDGYYRFEKIPSGEYMMNFDTSKSSIKQLKYYSKKPASEDISDSEDITKGIPLTINQDLQKDIGLMQGWMTNPFHRDANAVLACPVDLDYRVDSYRDFRDVIVTDKKYLGKFNGKPWGSDQHPGIDWDAKEGTPILAVAPAIVLEVGEKPASESASGALYVILLHIIGDRMFVTEYGHNSKNNVKQFEKVERGQVIAYVGHTGTSDNHVHFNLWELPLSYKNRDVNYIRANFWNYINAVYYRIEDNGRFKITVIDPFRDIANEQSENFWTLDNKPQYVKSEDNIKYKYLFSGMIIEEQDLASAASSIVSQQVTSNYVQKYFSPFKSGKLDEIQEIIAIGGREESDVLKKYLKAPRYASESYVLHNIDQEVLENSLIVIVYIPEKGRLGLGENILNYRLAEIEEGIKTTGQFNRVYESGGRKTIVFGAKDLITLDMILKTFDFSKYVK